jgi:hypothetical protein
MIGIYHRVSPKHPDKYIDEISFRYNNKSLDPMDMIDVLIHNSRGQMTYASLTNKD